MFYLAKITKDANKTIRKKLYDAIKPSPDEKYGLILININLHSNIPDTKVVFLQAFIISLACLARDILFRLRRVMI